MLPTPNTTHVPFSLVYEPAEDSYLMLDTLSSLSERAFLHHHFSSINPTAPPSTSTNTPTPTPPPASTENGGKPPLLALEIGSGSGILLSFLLAHSRYIFGGDIFGGEEEEEAERGGRGGVMGLATDMNPYACRATGETVGKALFDGREQQGGGKGEKGEGVFLEALQADLATPLRAGVVDLLLVNPPYVPTSTVPPHTLPPSSLPAPPATTTNPPTNKHFPTESHHLSQSYAGGHKGMEVTSRILSDLPRLLHPRWGVAYILLCLSNGPEEVKEGVRAWKGGWRAETVGRSGRWGGWEKLEVVRVWRGGMEEG